jgi:hypothetical protein
MTDKRTRQQLRDIIGESACCNDDACACHQAAWEAREELDARAEEFNRGPADALALMASSLLPPPPTDAEWYAEAEGDPLWQRFLDGDR